MQDLIKQLTEQAGITEAQAGKAIEVLVNYIKDKLPPMMHGVIDNFIGMSEDNKDSDILDS